MKHTLLLFFVAVIGCGATPMPSVVEDVPLRDIAATKGYDSTACAYWKCSATKKLYMQKYVRSDGGQWRPAGTFKLDEGIGAFPLEDLDKYSSDGDAVSIDVGFDPCPYCRNTNLGRCHCGKTLCEKPNATTGTCPWCSASLRYTPASWGVGGGG